MVMFKVAVGLMSVGALFAAAPAIAHGMEIGNDLERCSTDAKGPAVLVDVRGFAASTGKVRVQSYPATKAAWLAKGEWLGRIDVPVKASNGAMRFCMPVPQPGKYGIAVRHDRDGNGKTDISRDGGGFSNNPSISIFNLGKPGVEKAAFYAGPGVTKITINLKYM
ncbi:MULTISPECIES: DUF2141 domain-containing protein [Sphingobium]|jgi:uncharacterized protein (DUF2141 family)|uniref:DUF2141 domain-containing protein n=2 Tax=Sphingobium fuliginis (strain ATCC 27551) TaxID=336203 RepID=A0A292ZGS3_SPHSA|nr:MULTISPECIES: DUF2141 domain-containing protein [Sphingobium]OAP32696.1 hypothetical protein A8O16_07350 [Sphingobium sp. 20006FA]AJR22438.1 hypothetical protein TZ53_00175 [Sphingobium sp. YBL2]KXU31578.1 hypothetical protein AXW74_12020 [Sphingobium sp. AM]KYC33514.1 hypothetical protein A0J57_05230 [Sphingobium sp. 22B]MCB4860849.1 DUF2141 domain-containing protein [Sphingobium sp. PNB]